MKVDVREHFNFIKDLMKNIDHHKEIYTETISLDFSKTTRSGSIKGNWTSTEVNCLLLTGKTKNSYGDFLGTRYIYEEDPVYSKLLELYNGIISKIREEKINYILY